MVLVSDKIEGCSLGRVLKGIGSPTSLSCCPTMGSLKNYLGHLQKYSSSWLLLPPDQLMVLKECRLGHAINSQGWFIYFMSKPISIWLAKARLSPRPMIHVRFSCFPCCVKLRRFEPNVSVILLRMNHGAWSLKRPQTKGTKASSISNLVDHCHLTFGTSKWAWTWFWDGCWLTQLHPHT